MIETDQIEKWRSMETQMNKCAQLKGKVGCEPGEKRIRAESVQRNGVNEDAVPRPDVL